MDLILVRHAIAFERDSKRWPDDSKRPLTPMGVERFEQSASGLRRVAAAVDVVLSSPFARAKHTARILEDVAGWPKSVDCPVLEPSNDPASVVAFLQQNHDKGVIALVGHEPLLGELAGALLCGTGAPAQPFKKGGAACFRSDHEVLEGGMSLLWWLPPTLTRKMGSK